MSRAPLALTLPTDGAASTRRVLIRMVKKMARDAVRLSPTLFPAHLEESVHEVQALLRNFGAQDPRPLYAALRCAHVHVLLTCTLRSMNEGDAESAGTRAQDFYVALLTELAAMKALPRPISWTSRPPTGVLSSATYGICQAVPDDVDRLVFDAGSVNLHGDHTRRLTLDQVDPGAFDPIEPGLVLSLFDVNPISDFEAHPDKAGNQLDLGEATADEWKRVLSESLQLIDTYLPETRAEMRVVLQQFIPVGTDEHQHLSASYREAIGVVYLTLHPHIMTMTEAVIHEFQHNKLNALFHLDDVLHNAFYPLYTSPVRPDPRPLHGVLLAAHAFVPVAELYRRMRDACDPQATRGRFESRFAEIIQKNHQAIEVLENADPTERGAEVLKELREIHGTHLALGVWSP